MAPVDAFLVNDPYYGANHLPDFIVVGPLFAGGEMVGFAASMAHHTDVGGLTPRSMPATATEIFHEGLRIPPVKLAAAGAVDQNLLTLIGANSRLPEERMADLGAQIATIQVAQNRIDELARRYDMAQLRFAMAQIIRLSEQTTRACIAALPDQVWTGEAQADFGGVMIPLRVAISKNNDVLNIDFTGSGPQTESPFNSCLANTLACVYMAVRITLAQGIPANAGMYRALNITIPDGSILNPRFPAAISAATQVSYHTFEALMDALSAFSPALVLAGTGGGGVFSLAARIRAPAGCSPMARRWGGSGASHVADGESGMIPPVANLHDTPVEVLEMSLPVRILRYELVEGSAGRGASAAASVCGAPSRCLRRCAAPSRSACPPAGRMVYWGTAGAPTRIIVTPPDAKPRHITGFSELSAPADTLIEVETAGGGGYGPAAERDPTAAEQDRLYGYGVHGLGFQAQEKQA
ncbi:hydantoinase B/oxoprolinase family protein [Sodalis ligni]|uniref:hydantoinase B/oxoprolinase family protein n=1 Tax=Sodalis ligni TaxID=2697027 RepID=UPI001BDE3AF6|nr:hydantoinase B/oxoprolinase family protein [Sodalis ligni]QWA10670.1 hydantoinase B/oxoprolinase family protein [Sodalis ligni]